MSAFVIVSVNQSTFYLVMTAICVASSLFFLLLKKPMPHQTIDQQKNPDGPDEAEKSTKSSVKDDIVETYNLMLSKRMI
jgi:hypothetical protein